jgi:hypothetical protein
MAIKTSWTEVNKIIKEEFQRLMEKKKIQNRLQQINEELGGMEAEDAELSDEETLDEVEVSGTEKVRSHAWTGDADGDEKFKPKFEKKGTHLLEDEEVEGDEEEEVVDGDDEGMEMGDDEGVEIGDDEGLEIGDDEGLEIGDDEEDSDINLAGEFAELGAAIEAKIMAALGKAGVNLEDTISDDEDFEEVEVGSEDGDTIEFGAEEGADEEIEPETEEGESEEDEAEEKLLAMPMNESKIPTKGKFLNVLSEGLDANKKAALSSEMDRMRKLARLGGDE